MWICCSGRRCFRAACYIFWLGGLDCRYLLVSYGLEALGSGVNIPVDCAGNEAGDTALRPRIRFLS
jgi:hypothetical protein